MPLVTSKEMLLKAQQGGYAVGAFNATESSLFRAVVEEAQAQNAPAIVQVAPGEFDFATGSGWMYSVNGIYPNYGFSDCYLQDGDVLRVRFTLRYGADIGGAMASGNGGNEGDSGNWEKEW